MHAHTLKAKYTKPEPHFSDGYSLFHPTVAGTRRTTQGFANTNANTHTSCEWIASPQAQIYRVKWQGANAELQINLSLRRRGRKAVGFQVSGSQSRLPDVRKELRGEILHRQCKCHRNHIHWPPAFISDKQSGQADKWIFPKSNTEKLAKKTKSICFTRRQLYTVWWIEN